MAIRFYPHDEDMSSGSVRDKLDVLLDSAERYKAAMLDAGAKPIDVDVRKRISPREFAFSYNWQELAKILHEIRDMQEISPNTKSLKAEMLTKLAEIYEVLRGAKMPKLEAVRLALLNEAGQLRGSNGSTQVA